MSGQNRKTKNKQKQKETLVYCGPSLKGLPAFSVFKGDPPNHVQTHMKNNGAVKELMVSSDQVKTVRNNVAIQGTREYQLYKNAIKYSKGGES